MIFLQGFLYTWRREDIFVLLLDCPYNRPFSIYLVLKYLYIKYKTEGRRKQAEAYIARRGELMKRQRKKRDTLHKKKKPSKITVSDVSLVFSIITLLFVIFMNFVVK